MCKGEEVTGELGKLLNEHHSLQSLPNIKVTQGG
jgi:hypothetical protein